MRSFASRLCLVASAAGCNVVFDFTLTPREEVGALCADGYDNDFDGLTDCQAWGCLGERICCDIPEVVLADEFERPEACPADGCTCEGTACQTCPDPTTWYAWRCPYPQVSGGGLWPSQSDPACQTGGVIGRVGFAVEPGVAVVAGIGGVPEANGGYLELGLTLKDEADLSPSLETCAGTAEADPFVAIVQRRAGDGYQFVARFLEHDVGTSPTFLDGGATHQVGLTIKEDRHVSYSVDDVVFATTGEPVAPTERSGRLVLQGVTERAHVTSVKVVAGRLCHSPTAWAAPPDPIGGAILSPASDPTAWDRGDVYAPSVRRGDAGTTELYYTGCWPGAVPGRCDPLRIAIGRATEADAVWVRDPDSPLFVSDDLLLGAGTAVEAVQFRAMAELPPAGFATAGDVVFRVDTFGERPVAVLHPEQGSWASSVCCAQGVRAPDGRLLLYYAGKSAGDDTWRIGLATSMDGRAFTRHESNPVLREGSVSAFDARAVRDPVVVFDEARGLYRMWYVGADFYGFTAIGYAVSVDGVVWSKAPDNPVLLPEDFALDEVGSPAVLVDGEGKLRMWLDARTPQVAGHQIYPFANQGAPTSR